jgi:hypothetical protein
MREGLLIGLLYAAVGGLVTALAAQYAGPRFWVILEWSMVALILGCIASLVLLHSHQTTGRPFWMPAILINLGLCLITGGFVWHYSTGAISVSRPLANFTDAQLRERAIAVAQGLRQLQNEYDNKAAQLSFQEFQSMRQAPNDEDKRALRQRYMSEKMALSNQMEMEFRNRFRSDAIILREELSIRLDPLPLPTFQPFGPDGPKIPGDPQIFDKSSLTGPAPLASGADLLEYWAKQLK